MKSFIVIAVAGLFAVSAIAREPEATGDTPPPVDPHKVGYALGMNLGMQIKSIGAEVDVDELTKGVKDVLDGKPTKLQVSDLRPLFMQEQAYELGKKKGKGAEFMAQKAKETGVVSLSDGLAYKIVQPGSGETIGTNNYLVINFRGSWIDGSEFRHKEHIMVSPQNCPPGLEEALKLMKPGSKWQVFVPTDLAYGHLQGRASGFGSTLVYDLDLISVGMDKTAEPYAEGRLGHTPADDFLPTAPGSAGQSAANQTRPANTSTPGIIK